ncbi:DNA polymerase IV [Allobranchiibius sp. GilTou38]|nr:DNA polymerase IV [Allobranchiibius sp. GilTou38]
MFVSILHADLDSFYASVEQRDDPSLRDRPMAVGGGILLAASYEAKACGVRTAMSERVARSLCPDLVVVPPRMSAYTQASRAVFEVFHDITPVVEGISIDEAFLDVGGLRRLVGPPELIARTVRSRVRSEVGLPISVGVAQTKFVAKIASAVSKPDGLLVVPAGGETAFLHPLPIERLWGVGKVTSAKLHARGIATIGQLAAAQEDAVVGELGAAAGHHLWALANVRDPRPVTPGRRRRSMGAQRAIGGRPRTGDELDEILMGLVEKVCGRLRDSGRWGATFTLRLRLADFNRITRSRTLPLPSAATQTFLRVGRELLEQVSPLIADRGITLLGITIAGLTTPDRLQPMLPFDAVESGRVDQTLDEIRERFGNTALTRGVHVGRSGGWEMPRLPE